MNFTCEREKLFKYLSIAINSINDRSNIESIKCFKLQTENNHLIITSNNMDTNIISTIPVQVIKEGNVLVHARTFLSIISKISNKEISLYVSENNTLLIQSGNSTYNIYTMNVDEFPDNMEIDQYKEITVNQKMFKDMIRRVAFSASSEEEKVILNGVFMDINSEKETITFVAADGYRLAKDEIKSKLNDSVSVIIPIKSIEYMMNIFSILSVKDFIIRVGQERILFLYENIQIYSRLVNGKFPDYKLLIPEEAKLKIKIKRKEVLDACERIYVIAQKNSNMIKVEIQSNFFIISSVTPDFGDGSEKIMAECDGDTNIQIVFSVKVFIEALKNLDAELVYIDILSDEKPITIKEENNNSYIYIMMPVKLKK